MKIQEEYLLLFTDSLVSNLAINPTEEFAIYSMKIFGIYENSIIIITATIAFLIAVLINYFFGRFINLAFSNSATSGKQFFMIRLRQYIWLLLAFSFIPFWGKFFPVLAGVIKARLSYVLVICAIVKCSYYIYHIYF
jgi:membrane protein YqaA with SNARE-associated domain